MGKSIMIMAGGTGGHIFPALAVAQNLLEKGWQVTWLGTEKGLENRIVPEQGIIIDYLPVAGMRGKNPILKLKSLVLLIKACIKARQLLKQRKPDVVLGMGGFVAGPGGLMAKMQGIPLVIHEQNRIPGTTNRWLAKMATRVLEAFPGSFNAAQKAETTGNPLRKALIEQAQTTDSPPPQTGINILIVGGSQGAQALNTVIPEALAQIKEIAVKHQTGSAMQKQVAERYAQLAVKADVQAFITDIVTAYQWADLIICRAGAMTVSEVAAMGLPAILIPLPGAIDDHQTANAHYLSDAGASIILTQNNMTPTTLIAAIDMARSQLPAMSEKARACARMDATEVVAEICRVEAGA